MLLTLIFPADASSSEERLALVVGNASYRAQRLETAANDAGFVAGKLRTVGFGVTHTSDLDSKSLKGAFSDFVEKVREAGPDTLAIVYFSGYGLQLEGENYLLPVDVDTDVEDVSDLPRLAVRVSDLTRALSALRAKGAFVVLDAARRSPFLLSGQPSARGLAWHETLPDVLVAFNAAPGMVSPDSKNGDGYSSYARAIAEMMGDENSTLADAFVRARIRVNEMTRGEQVPWHSSGIGSQLAPFERVASKGSESQELDRLRSRPMSSFSAQDAYFAAIVRDTLDSYADYLADHWRDPTAKRIRALLAVRREVLLWQRACRAGAPEDFWSYLERYPEGAHAGEARRVLQRLKASAIPPPAFKRPEYDIPSPLPGEAEFSSANRSDSNRLHRHQLNS